MLAELFTPEQITILTQIIFIDLVLAGDNAIIIGMVASKFPPDQRKKVIFWGIGGAVFLRIILTLLTAYLLQITGLRLIGGILLLYIVYKLYVDVIRGASKKEDIKVYYGKGCKACSQTGFRGRCGIYELLVIDDNIRELILKKSTAQIIRDQARQKGMTTLREDGWDKVVKGITTVEEILRVTQNDRN